MKTKAVLDRFEGEQAVLMVGEEQDQLVVSNRILPKGVQEGDWLQVDVRDDHVFSVALDPRSTVAAKKRILNKQKNLRKE